MRWSATKCGVRAVNGAFGDIVGAMLARLPWGEGEGGGYDGIWFRRDGHDHWQGELPALRKRRCRNDGGGRA